MLVMNPEPCKHDHEIAAAVEEWEERYRILKEEDKESELPESWRMTSLKRRLCGDIKKHVELQEDFKSYEELRSTIMRWATNKKLEKDRQKSDPMDCSNVNEGETGEPSNPEGKALIDLLWASLGEEGAIDMVNKGKGKDKGGFNPGKGQWFNQSPGKG